MENYSNNSEVAHDLSPLFKVYKDGRVDRFVGNEVVPPSVYPNTVVSSKDVLILPETRVSARLYLPTSKITHPQPQHIKLPLLIYFHGGVFCVRTAFCSGSSKVKKNKLLSGVVLMHPYPSGVESIGSETNVLNHMDQKEKLDKLWLNICPSTTSCDSSTQRWTRIFRAWDVKGFWVCCRKRFVERGWFYYETLRKSGWQELWRFWSQKGKIICFIY
ncbi:hypothetical protein BVC80_8535g6 [Macleaya cordata]|uniref:Alpha/beta hydrolase fold-3 n=1 Tax=Macleaya cordata TaxID=56857 RepID=A0A200PQD5_MACCD|nr:hypothetical protein BVC80_8535g6 [Macleaya cordata]